MMKQQKRNCYCLDEKKGEWKIKRNKKPNLNYGNNGEKKKNVFFFFFFGVFFFVFFSSFCYFKDACVAQLQPC